MSLYADYIKERLNKNIIETEEGFATFSINGEECYIEDIYVIPSMRKSNIATEMADKISITAKEMGCKYLTGSVVPSANNSTSSLKILLSYGFKLHSSKENFIIFTKEL